jgi:hypothetical protein
MKFPALVCALALIALPVLAAPGDAPIRYRNDHMLVPKASPVHFSGYDKRRDGEVIFRGRFLLTGTFYYGDEEFDGGRSFTPSAVIFTDKTVADRLPRFAAHDAANVIHVSNPDAFAKAVLPKSFQARVRNKATNRYATGHVAIWVDAFSAGMACNTASYEVRFVKLEHPTSVRLGGIPHLPC